MINFYLEVFPKEIRSPKIDSVQNSQNFLFMGGLAQMELKQLFCGESQRSSILHEDSPNAFPRGITLQYKKGLLK
jgi:hypothetical protein